jgi:hypothetical protein
MRVRLATILPLGLLSTLVACSSSSPTEPKRLYDEAIIEPTAVILHSYLGGLPASERFVVVRDSAQWAKLWAAAFAYRDDPPPLPVIDFTSEMVVGAGLGTRPSSGYDVTIEGMVVESDGATVLVVETTPGNNCVVLTVLTHPGVLVKMARIEGPVRFQQRTQTRTCG